MFDAYGRNIHYLRLSVTDLCNLRCRYCMPDGVPKLAHEDILTYEEFLRLAALFAQCGIDTVRITGGEPLVRRGVEQLTAGGKNCQSFVSGLPGYPGALAMDADGTLYIGYRWARSSWLEKNADSTLLRGIALRAGRNLQEKLFSLPADAPCAEAVDTADGSWKRTVSSKGAGGVTALCPVESRLYLGLAGSEKVRSANL